MNIDRHYLDLTDVAALIEAREVTSVETTRLQLERIAALDGDLKSYALVTADDALAQAEAADREIAGGGYRGPLHGVPVAVKDLFWTEGVPTAAGMSIHRDFRPTQDATVVHRLRAAGVVILGKLQMTEGAYSDHHPDIPAPVNPWDAAIWPGISSSGPGVAIAAGLCFGALGSDTGGSIRWPSAANGVTGLKPTWGRVSRHGAFALAPSMDHVGPMARSVCDTAVLLQAIAGADPADPTASCAQVPDYRAACARGVAGLRVGVDRAWNSRDVDPAVQAMLADVLEVFAGLGAAVLEVRFPDAAQAIADWGPICAVEAAHAHAATYPARRSEYGPVLASVCEHGLAISGVDHHAALQRRADFGGRVGAVLAGVDVLLTPVHPYEPPSLATIATLGEQPALIAGLQRYTCPFDLTGSPTITLTGGFDATGLPNAFQLVAADFGEAVLLRAAAAYQAATSWHRHHPVLTDSRQGRGVAA